MDCLNFDITKLQNQNSTKVFSVLLDYICFCEFHFFKICIYELKDLNAELNRVLLGLQSLLLKNIVQNSFLSVLFSVMCFRITFNMESRKRYLHLHFRVYCLLSNNKAVDKKDWARGVKMGKVWVWKVKCAWRRLWIEGWGKEKVCVRVLRIKSVDISVMVRICVENELYFRINIDCLQLFNRSQTLDQRRLKDCLSKSNIRYWLEW